LTFFTHKLSPSVGPFEAPVRWWARISERQRFKVLPSDLTSGTSSARQSAIALSNSTVATAGSSVR
jgi:type II secretory pathway component PulM